MNGYVCFYASKRFEVYANTLLEAKTKAIVHFNVHKRNQHMISVTLAEKAAVQVVHTAVD